MELKKYTELSARDIAVLEANGCVVEPYTVHGFPMLCVIYPLNKKVS